MCDHQSEDCLIRSEKKKKKCTKDIAHVYICKCYSSVQYTQRYSNYCPWNNNKNKSINQAVCNMSSWHYEFHVILLGFWYSPYKIQKKKTPHEAKRLKWWRGELEPANNNNKIANNSNSNNNNRNRRRKKIAPILKLGIKYMSKEISTVWQNVVVFQSRDKINNIMYDMSSSVVHGQTKR